MRRFYLLVCLGFWGITQGFGQNALADKTLYTLPFLNAGFSSPPEDLVPKDHFRMGAALEGFKVSVWNQSPKRFGFMFEASAVYYEAFELKYRDWVREQITYGDAQGSAWMVSPQIHGAFTYFLGGTKRYFLYASTGVVYKLRKWKASEEHLIPDGSLEYNVSTRLREDPQVIKSLWKAQVRQVSPFVHGRFGFNLVYQGRVLHVLKTWCDVYPAYRLEYKTSQLYDGEWIDNTVVNWSRVQGAIGFGVEFHGILGQGFGSF